MINHVFRIFTVGNYCGEGSTSLFKGFSTSVSWAKDGLRFGSLLKRKKKRVHLSHLSKILSECFWVWCPLLTIANIPRWSFPPQDQVPLVSPACDSGNQPLLLLALGSFLSMAISMLLVPIESPQSCTHHTCGQKKPQCFCITFSLGKGEK